MSLETWLAFLVASSIILVIPGPTIILVIGHSLAHGGRAALPLVVGVMLGDLSAMTLSLVGLGAVIAASATFFTLFKWVGAIYLIYMGVSLWRSKESSFAALPPKKEASPRSWFRNAFVVTALNPKSITFFVAFLPQFVSPAKGVTSQLFMLGTTFLVLATLNATLYAVFAGRVRDLINTPRAKRVFQRLGGSALIAAGLAATLVQRTA